MSEPKFTVRRRTFLGALALLLAPGPVRAMLSSEYDPIEVEDPLMQPPALRAGDQYWLYYTIVGEDGPGYYLRVRSSFTAINYVRHRSGAHSLRAQDGTLWPLEALAKDPGRLS